MEDKEIYEGEYDGIVLSIPSHAIEIIVNVTTYNDGNIQKYRSIYDADAIHEMREEYEDNCVRYVLTEEGQRYLDELKGK